MKRILVLMIAILVNSCEAESTVNNTDEYKITENLSKYLSGIEQLGFSGAVLVAKNGKQILNKGYGYVDLTKEREINSNTLFGIQSITKHFTATAILKLVEKKQLNLNDPISDFFKNIPSDKRKITIHQLLTHTSGIIEGTEQYIQKNSKAEITDFVLNAELLFEPGQSFAYSNFGYTILAIIIEKITGLAFDKFMVENIFKPLNMTNTGYRIPFKNRKKIIAHYLSDGIDNGSLLDSHYPDYNFIGSGDMISTTEDFFRWYKAISSNKILSKETQLKMFKEHTEGYGYGAEIRLTPFGKMIGHNGGDSRGGASYFRNYLSQDVLIVIFCNNDGENMLFGNGIVEQIEKIVFDKNVVAAPEGNTNINLGLNGLYELSPSNNLSIEQKKEFTVINFYGQKSINTFFNDSFSDTLSLVHKKIEQLLNEINKNYPKNLNNINNSSIEERRLKYILDKLDIGKSKYGDFVTFEILGVIPDWVASFSDYVAFIKIKYESSYDLFRIHWTDNKVKGIGGNNLQTPLQLYLIKSENGKHYGYHFPTSKHILIDFSYNEVNQPEKLILNDLILNKVR